MAGSRVLAMEPPSALCGIKQPGPETRRSLNHKPVNWQQALRPVLFVCVCPPWCLVLVCHCWRWRMAYVGEGFTEMFWGFGFGFGVGWCHVPLGVGAVRRRPQQHTAWRRMQ